MLDSDSILGFKLSLLKTYEFLSFFKKNFELVFYCFLNIIQNDVMENECQRIKI